MGPTRQHIVITGGASGLGLALLQQLREQNEISTIARPSDGLDVLRKTHPQINIYEADLADIGSVERAADLLVKTESKIDILINNAAVQYTPRLVDEDFRYETIRREIDVNFTSVCVLIYLLMPRLLQSSSAKILNINSGLGLVPKTSSAIYCATKGALNILTRALRNQLEGTNINVRQVFLPLVDTAMTQGRGSGKMPVDEAATAIVRQLSTGRGDIYVGKVRALRVVNRIAPGLAARIMKAA